MAHSASRPRVATEHARKLVRTCGARNTSQRNHGSYRAHFYRCLPSNAIPLPSSLPHVGSRAHTYDVLTLQAESYWQYIAARPDIIKVF